MASILLENVSKSYDGKIILNDINYKIDSGFVALMGESGTGKTTLLRLISGLEKADSGSIKVEGKIAYVFAETNLFNSVSVLDNVTCVMNGDKKNNEAVAKTILDKLGLENEYKTKPKNLSTGMAQRVSIARAMASDREIYLLDEPFRGLDDKTKSDTMEYLKEYLSDKLVIMVTHDIKEAEYFTDKILSIFNLNLTQNNS